jgi:transcriptional antiterminator RfaH
MPWYVVKSKRRRESHAAASLERAQVEVYLPLLRKPNPRAGQRSWEVLFPNYLFASLTIPSEEWLAARSAPDVDYFLGHQGHPVALPDDFVPALRARLERTNQAGGAVRLQPGARVRITAGPFRYLEAIFERQLSPKGRAEVLVQVLQRMVRVQLPEHHLDRLR